MSTLREVIARVDAIKPNAYSDETKVSWLNALEGRIVVGVFQMRVAQAAARMHSPDDLEQELLVKFPHDDIYEAWLAAKIDFANGEYEKYQNSMAMYNELYEDFVQLVAMRYNPAQMEAPEEREALLDAYLADEA